MIFNGVILAGCLDSDIKVNPLDGVVDFVFLYGFFIFLGAVRYIFGYCFHENDPKSSEPRYAPSRR